MKYANIEINFTPERLVEIASLAINGLREDDEDSAMEYFRDIMELTDYEREFFGIPSDETEADEEYPAEYWDWLGNIDDMED